MDSLCGAPPSWESLALRHFCVWNSAGGACRRPYTGEVLPDDHVCNKGDIVRALNCVLQNCDQKPPRPQPENAGKPWTEEQDRELCGLYDSRTGIRQLSRHFKRTTGAITARLVRLGKIQER